MTGRRPRGPRRGLLHHFDVDQPFDDVIVPRGVSDVLVLVHHDGAVIGQTWLPAHRSIVPASEIRAGLEPHRDVIRKRRLRAALATAVDRPPAPSVRRTISVVVCTRDRPDHLRSCLESLLALQRDNVELLVVDNGSTDDRTRAVCAELGVRMVVEPRPGQTRARNCGVAATSGELVAFTDDDVVVDAGWLDDVDAEFDDPITMIATGYIGPAVLDAESQVFFEAHGGFERRPDRTLFDAEHIPLVFGTAGAGAGANMVVRRQLFEEIGGFDETFGAGTPTRTSDDKIFFYRTLEAGFRIRYDPARIVWHQHRASPAALDRIYRDHGTGEFTWASHVLTTRGDLRALQVYRWWVTHFVKDVARWRLGRISGIPPRYTWSEIRGALAAPRALQTVTGASPAGGPTAKSGWTGVSSTVVSGQPSAARTSAEALVGVSSETPSVSVAIATYNRRSSLERVLRKLDRQTFPRERFEVVVVVDGSSDGSAEMARSIDVGFDLRVIEQPNNRGLAVGRNVGAAAAKYDIVAFLDDDIEPRPEWLVGHATTHEDATSDTWVMGYFPPVPGSSIVDRHARSWWEDHFRRKSTPGHRWTMVDLVDGNSSVPARLFRRMEGFDEDFTSGRRQDYEMGLRLIEAEVPMAFAPNAVADHRAVADLHARLKNGFTEGQFDALIARKHPAAWEQLPIVMRPNDIKSRFARVGAANLGLERCAALGDRLEQIGQHELWRKLFTAAWWAQYLAGFEYGSAGVKVEAPVERKRDLVILDLDDVAGSAIPANVANLELVIRAGGRPVAMIPALRPGGEQWDWDDLLRRATDATMRADPDVGAAWR